VTSDVKAEEEGLSSCQVRRVGDDDRSQEIRKGGRRGGSKLEAGSWKLEAGVSMDEPRILAH
jgi:hypothetical protein